MAKVDQSKTCTEFFIIFFDLGGPSRLSRVGSCVSERLRKCHGPKAVSMNSHELAVLVKGQERH